MACYIFNFTKKGARKDQSLREQASALLAAGMWGIGDSTPNRERLGAGDQILAYVGAPERQFVGDAVVGSPVHTWSPAEVARYPGDWGSGVLFAGAQVWEHPLALQSIWSKTVASRNNPHARFFAGVSHIRQEDFELICGARGPNASKAPAASATPIAPRPPAPTPAISLMDRLFAEAERLKDFASQQPPPALSEDATRAHFINRLIHALGYTGFADVDFGVPVDSGDVADYVLRCGGEPSVVVEAKKLGAALGPREAAQVVKYASVLGLRWGVLTDGRRLKVYDPRVPRVSPENRLVFELDLADYADREDFEVRLYPPLELLALDRIDDPDGLERHASMAAVRELLTTESSKTLVALREELKSKKLVSLSAAQIADLLDHMLV